VSSNLGRGVPAGREAILLSITVLDGFKFDLDLDLDLDSQRW